jgi:hypothetical protein
MGGCQIMDRTTNGIQQMSVQVVVYCPWWLFGMPWQLPSHGQPITTLLDLNEELLMRPKWEITISNGGIRQWEWIPKMIALNLRCKTNQTCIRLNVWWEEWTGRTNIWVIWADESEQLSYKKWTTRWANSEHNLRVVSVEMDYLAYLRWNQTEDCSILWSIVWTTDRCT